MMLLFVATNRRGRRVSVLFVSIQLNDRTKIVCVRREVDAHAQSLKYTRDVFVLEQNLSPGMLTTSSTFDSNRSNADAISPINLLLLLALW